MNSHAGLFFRFAVAAAISVSIGASSGPGNPVGYLNHKHSDLDTIRDGISKEEFEKNDLNRFGARTIWNFEKYFPGAYDSRWFPVNGGAMVLFKLDGIDMKTAFDFTGRKEYTYTYYYNEKSIPWEILDMVRSEYRHYRIYNAVRAEIGCKTMYIVKMENENRLVAVTIFDGLMEETENYHKSR